jgi:hypothetical protein
MIILFLGAAIGVVGKKLMHDEVVTVIGVLVALAGMFLSVYPYVMLPPRSKRRGEPSSEFELEAQSEPQKNLPQERTTEYVPSIAERTTDLLTSSGGNAETGTSQKVGGNPVAPRAVTRPAKN